MSKRCASAYELRGFTRVSETSHRGSRNTLPYTLCADTAVPPEAQSIKIPHSPGPHPSDAKTYYDYVNFQILRALSYIQTTQRVRYPQFLLSQSYHAVESDFYIYIQQYSNTGRSLFLRPHSPRLASVIPPASTQRTIMSRSYVDLLRRRHTPLSLRCYKYIIRRCCVHAQAT